MRIAIPKYSLLKFSFTNLRQKIESTGDTDSLSVTLIHIDVNRNVFQMGITKGSNARETMKTE